MPEQIGDHVQRSSGVRDVTPVRVTQLVRRYRQPGSTRAGPQQLVQGVGANRSAERAMEQIPSRKSLPESSE